MKIETRFCLLALSLAACQAAPVDHSPADLGPSPTPSPSPPLSMPTPRIGAAAVTGLDGAIYVIGGYRGLLTLTTVERYDPAQNSWETLPPLPQPRTSNGAVTAADGRIFLVGGVGSEGATPEYVEQPTVDVFTPATGTWSRAHSMAAPRSSHGVVLGGDGRIYAIGGTTSADHGVNAGSVGYTTAEVEAYDFAADSWTSVSPLSTDRAFMGAQLGKDQKIYVFGGYSSSGNLKTGEVYDSTTNAWSRAPILTGGNVESGTSARGADGTIYLIGGNGTAGGKLTDLASVEIFDSALGLWQSAPSLPAARYSAAAATAADGRIFVFGGGAGDSSVFGDVYSYTPGSAGWND